MGVKETARFQYERIVDSVAVGARNLHRPRKEGWLRTVRKALGMSGQQLARRLGVTRATALHAERAELDGAITIKKMEQMAEAMGCRFVYAVVPDKPIREMLSKRAYDKAMSLALRTSGHMALEDQALTDERFMFEVKSLQKDLLEKRQSSLWDDA